MDHEAAATSLPNWNPVPSLRAELGARLPLGVEEGGDHDWVPVHTENVQGWCQVQCPAS